MLIVNEIIMTDVNFFYSSAVEHKSQHKNYGEAKNCRNEKLALGSN